jgi:hypothetical protein
MSDEWFLAVLVIGCLSEAVVFYVIGFARGLRAERKWRRG